MNTRYQCLFTAAVLSTVAGWPCLVAAQNQTGTAPAERLPAAGQPRVGQNQPGTTPKVISPADRLAHTSGTADWSKADFRGWAFFSGANIVNNTGEKVGDIKDLVIDRGSGRVMYAIVTTDKTLGMGGKTVAVPMDSIGWDAERNNLSVRSSAEDLKAYAEFSDEDWQDLSVASPAKPRAFRDRFTADTKRDDRRWDTNQKPETLDGKVTSVERVEMKDGEEMTVVTVEGANGSRRVALGPSWFVGSSGSQPVRGDSLSVSWVPARDANVYDADATEWRREKNTVSTYSPDGMPAWDQPSYKWENKEMGMASRRLVRASDLNGAKVRFRGVEGGEIEDLIFDRATGRVTFISIDPNENFMGMGDTKRLIPWNVSGIAANGDVMVDADKAMVSGAAEKPANLNDLRTGIGDQTYKAYNVQPPRYRATPGMGLNRGVNDARMDGTRRDNDLGNMTDRNSAKTAMNRKDVRSVDWATNQAIAGAMNYDTARKITGRVTSIDEMDCGKAGKCLVATVDADNGTEKVILCPVTDRTREEFGIADGDLVRFGVVKADFGSAEPMWLATSLTTSGRDEMVLFTPGNKSEDNRKMTPDRRGK